MKDKRIVATDSPVTTVIVSGTPHHYFHSQALGKCRAILIAPDENLSPALSQAPIRQSVIDWCQEVDKLCEKIENKKVVLAAFNTALEIAMDYLKQIPLSEEKEYQDTLERIRQLRTEIWNLEQSDL